MYGFTVCGCEGKCTRTHTDTFGFRIWSCRIFLSILEATVKPVREFESERGRSKENLSNFVQSSFVISLRGCVYFDGNVFKHNKAIKLLGFGSESMPY